MTTDIRYDCYVESTETRASGPTAAALQELLDRALLRSLVEGYASFADQGEPERVAGLFTEDAKLIISLTPGADPTGIRNGRGEIAAAMAALSRFWSTTHVIANFQVEITGDTAAGAVGCVAHHIEGPEGARRDRVLYIRYSDAYVRADGGWRIARREVKVVAVENRPLQID
jgi:uncharacterized protein (TIGR02246 family)